MAKTPTARSCSPPGKVNPAQLRGREKAKKWPEPIRCKPGSIARRNICTGRGTQIPLNMVATDQAKDRERLEAENLRKCSEPTANGTTRIGQSFGIPTCPATVDKGLDHSQQSVAHPCIVRVMEYERHLVHSHNCFRRNGQNHDDSVCHLRK